MLGLPRRRCWGTQNNLQRPPKTHGNKKHVVSTKKQLLSQTWTMHCLSPKCERVGLISVLSHGPAAPICFLILKKHAENSGRNSGRSAKSKGGLLKGSSSNTNSIAASRLLAPGKAPEQVALRGAFDNALRNNSKNSGLQVRRKTP